VTNENLVLWLRRHGACKAALDWLGDRDPATAWEECESPEWMIWACDHAGIPDSTMRLLACRLVRETQMGDGRMVWDLLTDERSRTAVEVAERYARGEATNDELTAAAWAAERAWASAAARAAAFAAWATAAWAAARASEAARAAAAWASAANAAQCRIIREMISVRDIESAMEANNDRI
jgi:hypothetical protein